MRLPFRVALLTVLLSLLTATVSVVGVLSYLNAHQNASELARRVLALRPDDGPAKTMLTRTVELIHDPPEPGWDGTYRMTKK
jgi:hypothetical protein